MQNKALSVCLDFGAGMMSCGAEIGRVEDSLRRLGASFGAEETEVFAITACLVMTLRFPEGEYTGTRRFRRAGQNDFEKLCRLNDLSRRCALSPLSPEEAKKELGEILCDAPSPLPVYFGSALAAGAFAVFFGGGLWDAALSALAGLLICLLQLKGAKFFPNHAFFLFTASLLGGVAICLTDRLLPLSPLQIDKVIIGDIMLLVPGVATTLAVRDLFIGDTISGITKLSECILHALSLAAGFILALMLCGR